MYSSRYSPLTRNFQLWEAFEHLYSESFPESVFPVTGALLSRLLWEHFTPGHGHRAPALQSGHMAPVLRWPDEKAGTPSKEQTPKHILPKNVKLKCSLTALVSPAALQYSLSPPGLMHEPQRDPAAPQKPPKMHFSWLVPWLCSLSVLFLWVGAAGESEAQGTDLQSLMRI